jgi:hypothetical protein
VLPFRSARPYRAALAARPQNFVGMRTGGARFLTLGWPSSHIKRMEDPGDSFNSTVLLLRHIGETHEWEITIRDQGEKPMSRFTFRGSRREADDMAIRGRLAAEVKLEATARNVKRDPAQRGGPSEGAPRARIGAREVKNWGSKILNCPGSQT